MARFLKKELGRLDLKKLFEIVEAARFTDRNGKTSFRGDQFFEAEAILSGAIDINPEIRGSTRESIRIRGIREACKKDPLTTSSLLGAVKRAEFEHLQKTLTRFVVLGNISIDPQIEVRPRRLNRGKIYISFPQKFPGSFERHSEMDGFLRSHGASLGRLFRASVWARTPDGAMDRVHWELDLLRGFWNIALTHGERRYFNSHRQPMNRVLTGPAYSVYFPNGRSAEKQRFWFEPGYPVHTDIFRDPVQEWPEVERFEKRNRRLLGLLTKGKYQSVVGTALVRYSRALDSTIWDTAVPLTFMQSRGGVEEEYPLGWGQVV